MQEVLPGYFTIVDREALKSYRKDGKIFVIHHYQDLSNIVPVVKNGLLSSHERYKRGLFKNGMSTDMDFETGGAESAFFCAVPEDSIDGFANGLIIDPQILNRTDWYSYYTDRFGALTQYFFDSRPAPEDFFSKIKEDYSTNCFNEIMMERGVPPEMIRGIVVGRADEKTNILADLQRAGIHEVNGMPIDQFIIVNTGSAESRIAASKMMSKLVNSEKVKAGF